MITPELIPDPDPTPQPSNPLGATATWLHVTRRAGQRCECIGTCGSKHSTTGRRCGVESGQYVKGVQGPVRLAVGPEDPTLPPHHAARLTEDQLRAWCPRCWHGTIARFRAAQRRIGVLEMTESQESLF